MRLFDGFNLIVGDFVKAFIKTSIFFDNYYYNKADYYRLNE